MIFKFKNARLRVIINYIGAVMLVSALSFVPQTLFASGYKSVENELSEKSFFEKGYDAVYQFVDSNEYLFSPISSAIAGMTLCGFWCAMSGGMAGTADELLVYFGYTDKRYLSWGVFGAATANIINPLSAVSSVAGAVVGVLVPAGILNNHQELIAPAVSVVSGNYIGGSRGIVSVGAAGAIDELLLNYGVTDKHYLTFCTVGATAVNMLGLGFNPLVTYPIGALLGLIAAGYEEEIVSDLLSPIKTATSLYGAYGKFIPKEQLGDHMEKHVLALLGNQFLTQFLSLKILGSQQNLVYNFERLDNAAGQVWDNFKNEITNFAIFLFPYVIEKTLSKNVDNYFNKKLHVTLEEKIREGLFFGETALRLSHDQNNTVLIDSLKNDVYTVVHSGSDLITGSVSTSIGGAYGVGIVIVHSPNTFVYSFLYNKAKTLVANHLANQQRIYGEKVRVLDSKFISTFKHDAENVRTIAERDGMDATKERIHQLSSELRDLESMQRLWGTVGNFWWTMTETIDYVFNYFLVGRAVNYKKIPFDERNKVHRASMKTSELLSWTASHAYHTSQVEQSLDRIIILEGKLHSLPQDSLDQIDRNLTKKDQLIFQDLEIGFGGRVLVAIDDLRLDMGRTYAITGETGCGKTSLLSKVKGIKENGVYGKGRIYYPEIEGRAPKIVMLSQQDYFPLDSSLYEIISYPNKPSDQSELEHKEREEISLLLQEIGIYAFSAKYENLDFDIDISNNGTGNTVELFKDGENGGADVCFINSENYLELDSKKNWYTYLSGGEKKKVMIVSAIIKKPDILILDEVFNGLDPSSIVIVQQILRKYLPNTLILSVDHHTKHNNHGSFYDSELHISDGKIFEF